MVYQNPEFFYKISQEQKFIDLKNVCFSYFDNYFANNFNDEDKINLRNEIYYLSENVPAVILDHIIIEAKRQGLNIPESTFLSDEAFEKIKKSWEQYKFLINIFNKFPKQIKKEISELNPKGFSDPDEDFVAALIDNQVVGYTRFQSGFGERIDDISIIYQRGKLEHPGVGLGMLNELITKAKQLGYKYIHLSTDRIPKGLGNLGFHFDEENNHLLSAIFYQLDL
ncbi:MAG: GNAT family N-acetyltransferase [Patescibacteria group bacterium]|nr:GNAT family N-acetyltransferase [Patescibacteria group bacterium]